RPRPLPGHRRADQLYTLNCEEPVILDFPYRYRAWLPGPSDDVTGWQEKVPLPDEIDQVILWLRASLVLAVDRETRPHIVQTWQHENDPLADGVGSSWRDPRFGRGFTPVQLDQPEVDAWHDGTNFFVQQMPKRSS
ncbi:hypothetical protein ACFPJ1_31230, partial [Kribbella qitaiheensis]|uniref:hypothetical protein n=1 Tax=Kribbella qitaiheensis TaxID=1544730 RepID=UPI00361FFEE9